MRPFQFAMRHGISVAVYDQMGTVMERADRAGVFDLYVPALYPGLFQAAALIKCSELYAGHTGRDRYLFDRQSAGKCLLPPRAAVSR